MVIRLGEMEITIPEVEVLGAIFIILTILLQAALIILLLQVKEEQQHHIIILVTLVQIQVLIHQLLLEEEEVQLYQIHIHTELTLELQEVRVAEVLIIMVFLLPQVQQILLQTILGKVTMEEQALHIEVVEL